MSQAAARPASNGCTIWRLPPDWRRAEYWGRVIHGDPAQQIIAMEQEVDADLIVVGKHGSHIAEELLLGSVTKHVLAESQCDVLVICDPRAAPDQSP